MARWRKRSAAGAAAGLALAVLAPAAYADIFAVTDSAAPAPRTDHDIALVDTAGSPAVLPAGINTTADESHPSISADGTRLVFERRPDSSTVHIVVADLTSGASSELLNGFDAAAIQPDDPSITPDGKAVLIGSGAGGGPLLVDISSFPSGPPYPRTDLAGQSHVRHPAAAGAAPGSLFAFTTSTSTDGSYGTIGGTALKTFTVDGLPEHATLGSPEGTPTVVFDVVPFNLGPGSIEFCAPLTGASACQPHFLPGVVNTSASESRPAFTPDGRYVGFLRSTSGGPRVFVWDSESQLLLDDNGKPVAAPSQPFTTNLSLYQKAVFRLTSISPLGQVRFTLASASLVGIVVQRVKGHRKLFGRTVPKLGPARRIPLGSFRRGPSHVHWNLRVGGKRLRPGTYQVTPRALTRRGKVRDLGKPRLLHVHRR